MLKAECNNFAEIRYVFLDRDGVINRDPGMGRFVSQWQDFRLLSCVEAAIARLNQAGRKVILVTNQRGVSLGLFSESDVEKLHQQLQDHLQRNGARLDAIYCCTHDDGQCNCRKPLPGLFELAFQDFPACHPGNSVMIGDSITDIEAGVRLGMRTFLIQSEAAQARPGFERAAALADALVASLADAVDRLLLPAAATNISKSQVGESR